MEITVDTLGKLEDFLETIPSKQTRKSYKNGISRMEEYLGHSIIRLIKAPDASKKTEKFFIWLKEVKGYSQNTCRNFVNGAVQFLKYYGAEIKLRRSLGVYRTEISLSDHLLTSDQISRMGSVADLREQVILEVLLLGLRASDASKLEKEDFDRLEEKAPISLRLRAKKEGTIYRTFISQEFKELLKLYLPKIEGKWLLPGKRKGRPISNDALNWTIQNLAVRSDIKVKKLLRWNCGRKLVLRSAAELGISQWSSKALTGKSIPKDIATYIEGLNLKPDFLKLHKVLRLKKERSNTKIKNIEQLVDLMLQAWKKVIMDQVKEAEIPGVSGFTGGILEEMSPEELLKLFIQETEKEKKD